MFKILAKQKKSFLALLWNIKSIEIIYKLNQLL